MNEVEQLTQKVQSLSPEDLVQFRAWFLEYDAQFWDQQIAADFKARAIQFSERGCTASLK